MRRNGEGCDTVKQLSDSDRLHAHKCLCFFSSQRTMNRAEALSLIVIALSFLAFALGKPENFEFLNEKQGKVA